MLEPYLFVRVASLVGDVGEPEVGQELEESFVSGVDLDEHVAGAARSAAAQRNTALRSNSPYRSLSAGSIPNLERRQFDR